MSATKHDDVDLLIKMYRAACERAETAERDRDSIRREEWAKAREHFELTHRQVMARLQASTEHGAVLVNRIAQLEAALRHARMILKSDSIEYDGMRDICTKDDPWTPDKGTPVQHHDAHEVGEQRDGWSGGNIVSMKCPNCGHMWTEELPQ